MFRQVPQLLIKNGAKISALATFFTFQFANPSYDGNFDVSLFFFDSYNP